MFIFITKMKKGSNYHLICEGLVFLYTILKVTASQENKTQTEDGTLARAQQIMVLIEL